MRGLVLGFVSVIWASDNFWVGTGPGGEPAGYQIKKQPAPGVNDFETTGARNGPQ